MRGSGLLAEETWHRMVELFWAWSNLVWVYWSALTLMAMVELGGGAIGQLGAMGWFGLTAAVPCLELFVLVYPVAHKLSGVPNCVSGNRGVEVESNHPCLIQWLIVTAATTFASVMWLATATSLSQIHLREIESPSRYDVVDGGDQIPAVLQLRWALNNIFVVLAWFAISLSNLVVQAYSHAKHTYTATPSDEPLRL